jgi:hypothetical protein
MADPDFLALSARVQAAELAYLQRNGFLCMYEHGEPVRADNPDAPVPYRVTPLGREWWEKFQAENREADARIQAMFVALVANERERKRLESASTPPSPDAPCNAEAWGWDANGSFVEVERKA